MQANSLHGREGRGKLPGRSRSGQWVRAIKVNMMDEDRAGQRARAPSSITRVLIKGQSSYGRDVGLRCNTCGLCRAGRLGSTSLGSNHNNCNHTVQPHIHTLQLNHTGIPERTDEVTRNQRGTYVPPNIWTFKPFITESPRSSHGGIKADLLRVLRRGRSVSLEKPAFRRHAGRMMGVSRNTSPVWCAAYARSPPRARAPFAIAGSGPPPSGTTPEASDASQSAAGFLQEKKKGLYPIRSNM